MTQQFYKNMALWVVILLMILLLVTMLRQSQTAPAEATFTKFMSQVEEGEVQSVTIEEKRIAFKTTGGQEYTLRFAIWDTGDNAWDSTVLIDGFEWIADGGTVTVGTQPEG